MKVATYRTGGERRVGVVDERRQTVSAFDLPLSEAAEGVLALIGRKTLPHLLSPTPLAEETLQAPVPRPTSRSSEPSSAMRSMAARTVLRATPYCAARSRSFGRRRDCRHSPDSMR